MPKQGFVKAVEEDKLSNNTLLVTLLDGVEVLICKVGGKIFATSARCTHKGCSLSEGWIEDGIIVCGCHLSKFDPHSGKVVKGPAETALKTFEVQDGEGYIWVKL
ncbi:MAG: Rieske (2Fe-2S) protein [Nitrososphaerales archaeon]